MPTRHAISIACYIVEKNDVQEASTSYCIDVQLQLLQINPEEDLMATADDLEGGVAGASTRSTTLWYMIIYQV
jgi:hypothetical protein